MRFHQVLTQWTWPQCWNFVEIGFGHLGPSVPDVFWNYCPAMILMIKWAIFHCWKIGFKDAKLAICLFSQLYNLNPVYIINGRILRFLHPQKWNDNRFMWPFTPNLKDACLQLPINYPTIKVYLCKQKYLYGHTDAKFCSTVFVWRKKTDAKLRKRSERMHNCKYPKPPRTRESAYWENGENEKYWKCWRYRCKITKLTSIDSVENTDAKLHARMERMHDCKYPKSTRESTYCESEKVLKVLKIQMQNCESEKYCQCWKYRCKIASKDRKDA